MVCALNLSNVLTKTPMRQTQLGRELSVLQTQLNYTGIVYALDSLTRCSSDYAVISKQTG